MPDNFRLIQSDEQTVIRNPRTSFSYSSSKDTTVVLDTKKVQAQMVNLQSAVDAYYRNPDATTKAACDEALLMALAGVPTEHQDNVMQLAPSSVYSYYKESFKDAKTSGKGSKETAAQAQLHQEQQAALTAQQIAQIKQQAAKDYHDFWKNHNKFDYAHASAAEREKWMQEELKKMPQWAQDMEQTAKTKPFNEAQIALQEQARQKLKDIEEKKKEMLAIINNPNATEKEKVQADLHYRLLQQETQNVQTFHRNVTNSKNSNGLVTASKQLEKQSNELRETAAHQANNTQESRVMNNSKQQAKSTTAYLSEADNNRINGKNVNATAQSLTHQSQEQTIENNKTVNGSKKQATSFAQASFKVDSDLTINSEGAAISFANAQTLKKESTLTAQDKDILSKLNELNIPSAPEQKNMVTSNTPEKNNIADAKQPEEKKVLLAEALKGLNTPKAPDVINTETNTKTATNTETTANTETALVQAPTPPELPSLLAALSNTQQNENNAAESGKANEYEVNNYLSRINGAELV